MFGTIRGAVFRFAGGFALTDMYACAVRPVVTEEPLAEDVSDANRRWFSWLPGRGGAATAPHAPNRVLQGADRFEPDTLRGDLDLWMEQNSFLSLGAMSFLVLSGGGWSIAGAACSIAFDGDVGRDRYITMRDELLDYWEGEG